MHKFSESNQALIFPFTNGKPGNLSKIGHFFFFFVENITYNSISSKTREEEKK